MLVDNPVHQQSYPFNTDPINDYLNLDLFSTTIPSNSQSIFSSRSSSPPAFPTLLTPPQSQPPIQFFPQDTTPDSSFFNFNFDDDFTKPVDPLSVPQPTSMAPYDFLGAFNALTSGANSASSSSSSSSGSGNSPDSATSPPTMLAIDPQLVGTPATSKAFSDFDEEEERDEVDNDDDDEDTQAQLESKRTNGTIAPVKVGGHGKLRKGTVQGGGVVKKAGGGVKDKENSGQKEVLEDGKPADYQKLSSKEKRQLRNKISARNFRVRRKEYITTLEGDIAERDRILDAIRTELGSSQSENNALRQEISALKRALLEGRGSADTPVLPPPGPIPPISVSSPAPVVSSSSTTTTNLLAPNTQKDLPTSPRLGSRGFWGGAGLGGVGITPVHTAIMPEWNVVGGLVKPILGAGNGIGAGLQENINPALNGPLADVGNGGDKPNVNTNIGASSNANGFDGFTEINPFTFKALDAYRMQLWGKMAAQQHGHQSQSQTQQQQQQAHRLLTPPSSPSSFVQQLPNPALFQQLPHQQHSQQQHLTGLAASLRPHYFAASTKHNYGAPGAGAGLGGFGALLSGKAAHASSSSSYPSPPSSPPMPSRALDGKGNAGVAALGCGPTREQQQHAVYAALASQTLLRRMGSAFWEAFSGAPGAAAGGASAGGGRGWDADKVRRVLEGKAVVRVVDVESAGAVGAGAVGVKESGTGSGESGGREYKCITELLEGMSLGLGGKKGV